jgi:hypothetical protein
MRFLLALARAQAFPIALGLSAALVLADLLVGAELLQVPFLQDAVQAGRIFPALFAGSAAVVVAAEWDQFERIGSRPVAALVLGRWVAGAAIALGSALLASAVLTVVSALYLLLGVLASALPKHWWLALPVLLYLQLYAPPDLLPQ